MPPGLVYIQILPSVVYRHSIDADPDPDAGPDRHRMPIHMRILPQVLPTKSLVTRIFWIS